MRKFLLLLGGGFLLFLLLGIASGQTTFSEPSSSSSTTSMISNDEDEDYYTEAAEDDTLKPTDGPKKKTLTFLKELRNITKEAGDFLKLRCEVTGSKPATSFDWYKNDAPLIEEKNRMKIKSKLQGDIQWSMLKFRSVETLDTAFYECRASNRIDTISSVAIITVELGKVFNNRKSGGGNQMIDHDDMGLLPETYSDPDFPGGMGRVEWEGGQQPTNFGNDNRFNQNQQQQSKKQPKNDIRRLGQNIPSLEPNERAGTCQPYVGSVCAKYVGQEYVFVTEGLTQQYIEQKLTAALTVITASPELSESCSHYAIPSICLATLPLCDRRTEKPRKVCREECELLEDQFCRKELAIARQHALLGTQMVLPVCNELPPMGSPGAATCVSIGIPQVLCYSHFFGLQSIN
jgi:hypothetical protein